MLGHRKMRRQRRRNLKRRTDQHSLALDAPSDKVVLLQDQYGRVHRCQLLWGEIQHYKAMEIASFDARGSDGRLRFEQSADPSYKPIGPWRPR